MEKIFSKRNIKIFNWLIIIAFILVFEFGFANCDFTVQKLTHIECEGFNFSLCRGLFYICTLMGVYFVNRSQVIDEVSKSYKNKTKKTITIIAFVIEFIVLAFYTYKFLVKQDLSLVQYSVISMMLICAFLAIINVTNKYFTNIISIFLIGSIFCITVNVYHVLDEKKHFMSAYNLSYANLNFGNPKVDKQFMEELPRGTHYSQLIKFFKVKYHFEQGTLPEEGVVDHTPAGYNPIIYLPSALGILLARILQGSVADVFLMGRLFNLLAYIGLITLTIKILPYKKNIFLMLMSIPIILCFSATYSLDGIGIGLVSLFVAYCLKYHENKDDIQFKNLVILAGIYTLVLCFKSMSYAFVGVLVFMLPIKRLFKEYYKKLIPLIIAFIILNIFLFMLQPKINLSDNRYDNIDAGKQIENIIHHPTIIFTVIFNHVRNSLLNWNWIKDFNAPAYLSSKAENVFVIMFIYYLYASFKDDSKNFNWKERVLLLLAFALTYGFTSGIMYLGCSPVGADAIGGYQLRYVFPITTLLLMTLSNKTLKQNNDKNFLMKLTSVQVLFISLGLLGAMLK